MTNDSAATLGNRILALDTDGDAATVVCIDVQRAIERRDARIAELEEKETCYRAAIDTIGPIENERDAALARVGEIENQSRGTLVNLTHTIERLSLELQRWREAVQRCEFGDVYGDPECLTPATRRCGDNTTGEWLFCDAHAAVTFPAETYFDLPWADLVRAGTGETEKAPDRKAEG